VSLDCAPAVSWIVELDSMQISPTPNYICKTLNF